MGNHPARDAAGRSPGFIEMKQVGGNHKSGSALGSISHFAPQQIYDSKIQSQKSASGHFWFDSPICVSLRDQFDRCKWQERWHYAS